MKNKIELSTFVVAINDEEAALAAVTREWRREIEATSSEGWARSAARAYGLKPYRVKITCEVEELQDEE